MYFFIIKSQQKHLKQTDTGRFGYMYGYIETRFLNSDLKSRLDQLVHLQKKKKKLKY
jgi:hypothetical protein